MKSSSTTPHMIDHKNATLCCDVTERTHPHGALLSAQQTTNDASAIARAADESTADRLAAPIQPGAPRVSLPFILEEPTDLCLVENSSERLEVRTRMASWWFGSLGVLALLSWIGATLHTAWQHFAAGNSLAALGALAALLLGGAFLALFAYGATTERLIGTMASLELQLRLGPLVLRRRTTLKASTRCVYVDGGDEAGSYQLELRTERGIWHFGSESQEANIRALVGKLRRFSRG